MCLRVTFESRVKIHGVSTSSVFFDLFMFSNDDGDDFEYALHGIFSLP